MPVTKVTVNLPDISVAELGDTAAKRQTTRTEALRSAISIDNFLTNQEQAGAKILIEHPDGKIERIVRR